MARTHLVNGPAGPHIATESVAGHRTARQRVSPTPSAEKIRQQVLDLLRARPELAPKTQAEKRLTAPDGVAGLSVTPPTPSEVRRARSASPKSPRASQKGYSQPRQGADAPAEAATGRQDVRYGAKDRSKGRFPVSIQG